MVLTERGTLPFTKDATESPLEMLLTVTFKEHNGKTEMTLCHMGVSTGADSKGADQGWNQSFDKPAESLKEMST